MEETAPRKPKQINRPEVSPTQETFYNYDIFQNEETSSFLSASFYAKQSHAYGKHTQSCSNSVLDVTLDDVQVEGNQTSIKYMPILYFFASAITLFGGVFSVLQQRKYPSDSAIPHFLELPFKQLHPFQVIFLQFQAQIIEIGVGIVCFTGIINNFFAYKIWQQSKQSFENIQLVNCFIGIFAQLSLLGFSCLPAIASDNQSEDCFLLNTYFLLSFIYQGVYAFCLVRSVPRLAKITYAYQIRIGFFLLCLLVFAFYISSSIVSQGSDEASESTHSICAFLLFSLNTIFISLLYFDLKTVSLIMKFAHIENVKSIRKFTQNIL